MDETVSEVPIKVQQTLSKNPILNEVLQQTKPFNATQTPSYAGAPTEVSSNTMKFDTSSTHTLGAQSIAQKMGYGDMQGGVKKQGLGVSTGLAGLDRVLNRDNSELIKAMDKKSNGNWRPGM